MGRPDLITAEAQRLAETEQADYEGFDGAAGYDDTPRFPDLPGELTFEPLATSSAIGGDTHAQGTNTKRSGGTLLSRVTGGSASSNGTAPSEGEPIRAGVLAIPDASVRLLLDELDRRGVDFDAASTFWHAAASAWDPAVARRRESGHGLTADVATACVVIDPVHNRLLWTWSTGGVLDAAGSMRVPRYGDHLVASEGLIGRLTADWMGWAAQIGSAPARIVCVAPGDQLGAVTSPYQLAEFPETDAPVWRIRSRNNDASEYRHGIRSHEYRQHQPQQSSSSPSSSLDLAGVGRAIGKAWPGATVDVTDQEDPVGQTLRRFAEQIDAGRDPAVTNPLQTGTTLRTLTDRPGRVHRGMYRWTAAALLLTAALLAVWGVQLRRSAGELQAEANTTRSAERELIAQVDPTIDARLLFQARKTIEDRTKDIKGRASPEPSFPEPRPVLQELETLSFIIGNPDYDLVSINLSSIAVTVTIRVETLEDYEALLESFDRISGSYTEMLNALRGETQGGIRATFTLSWVDLEDQEVSQ